MVCPDDEQNTPEKSLAEAPLPETVFTVPPGLRIAALWIIGAALIFFSFLLLRDFWDTEADTDPSKMDLIQFLVVLAVAFGICKLEWENFQFRIRKIGPVELDQIISTQADEPERDISELRKRVQALERAQSGRVLEAQSLSSPEPEKLKGLLERFLFNYAAWSFSPTRISTWGSKQTNFEKLSQYQTADIRRALQELVAEATAQTRISKNGNTLYRIAR